MRIPTLTLILAGAVSAGAAYAAEEGAERSVIERYALEEGRTPVRERPGWRKPQRVLVGGWIPGLAARLERAAPTLEIVTAGSAAEAAAKAEGVDVVVGICTPQVVAAGKAIQWIQMISAGVEQCVRIPEVRERGILVTNMQRIGGPIIAEHVMAMVLAFTRGLDIYIPAQRQREWRRITPPGRMTVIDGKTLLVVGLGGIGSQVAEKAHALGMRVTAVRASGRTGPRSVSYVGLPDELAKLAAQADFVVNTAPLTPATVGMFDAEFFAAMKPSAYFINVARGGSVVTAALIDALNRGAIAGAGLDVTDPEPLPADHPLWSAPNVIITPHVANDSDLGFDAQVEVISENLRRFAAGEPMLSVVDVERGY